MISRLKRLIWSYVDRRIDHIYQLRIAPEMRVERAHDIARAVSGFPAQVAGWSGKDSPSRHHTLAASGALAEGVAALYGYDIDGDVAEFGTMTGATAEALAQAMHTCDEHYANAISLFQSPVRQLHLFDSFEGLPEADNDTDRTSPHVVDRVWSAGTCRGVPPGELVEMVARHLPRERVVVHAGWFRDTVAALGSDTRFALVHIDGDLYSSAVDVLDGLLSRGLVQPGAYVFFDDWGCNRSSPDFGERRAWREAIARYDIDHSDQGRYAIFARCFTIHAYTTASGQRISTS